jgi:hypothetical protein
VGDVAGAGSGEVQGGKIAGCEGDAWSEGLAA